MNRILFTAILIVLVFSLSACDNNNSKSDNTLSEAKLTEREKGILSTTTDKSFVFDFNVDSTYKKASVWIEKYEFGKRVGNQINHITTEIKDKGTLIFAISETTDNKSMFTVSINNDGGTSSSSSLEMITEDGRLEGFGSVGGSNLATNKIIKGEMVLASICYSKKASMRTLSPDFYRDVDRHINEIKDYDIVYLLKSEFTK